MLSRLADLAAARPRRILLLAAIGALLSIAVGGPVASIMEAGRDNFDDPGSQSVVAVKELERAAGGVSPEADLFAVVRPADARRVAEVTSVLRADPGVLRVTSSEQLGIPSRDGRTVFLSVNFKPGSAKADETVALRLEERLGDSVALGGPVLGAAQVAEQVSKDLARAELLAFPLLAIVSLLVFRGLLAAALPLIVGMLAIVATFLVLRIAATLTPLSIFALNMVTGLGLGLAIDYSLLIVSRYREELEQHGPGVEALRRTLATAGRTVIVSSCTVALALASLLVFPQRFLYSMGIGGMAVALLAALVSLTVLPALLALSGARLRRPPGVTAGGWYRLSRTVMRRPLPIALVCGSVLLLAGVPALRVQFGGVDASVLPAGAGARQAAERLGREFPPNTATPVIVSVKAPRDAGAAVGAYAAGVAKLPGAAQAAPPTFVGSDRWTFDVGADAGPLTDSSRALVERIRDGAAPFPVTVLGESARFHDQQTSISDRLPLALALLALATMAVLFVATGSVVLPIKAVLLNALTLSATFGILVLIFQDGRLEGPLGFVSPGTLESGDMVLLFVIAFALVTDYSVFLLTRIQEARAAGASDSEAVALGLERTGRTVTAAALLFCIAIGAFATSEIVFIKALGVGTAVAVLIDATIVRALLVPSLMQLLGRYNWWAPGPLRRLHARPLLRRFKESPA